MMELKNVNTMAKGGYILLPRKLVAAALSDAGELTEAQAFICILYHVCYSRTGSLKGECRRGESFYSLREWAALFGWGLWKTRVFFDKLAKENCVAFEQTGRYRRLCVVEYEHLCGNRIPAPGKDGPASKSDELFEGFWKDYHEMTGTEPSDQYAAQQVWRKLNLEEKMAARDGIADYFWKNADSKYLKKAVNYLRDKTFLGL